MDWIMADIVLHNPEQVKRSAEEVLDDIRAGLWGDRVKVL